MENIKFQTFGILYSLNFLVLKIQFLHFTRYISFFSSLYSFINFWFYATGPALLLFSKSQSLNNLLKSALHLECLVITYSHWLWVVFLFLLRVSRLCLRFPCKSSRLFIKFLLLSHRLYLDKYPLLHHPHLGLDKLCPSAWIFHSQKHPPL